MKNASQSHNVLLSQPQCTCLKTSPCNSAAFKVLRVFITLCTRGWMSQLTTPPLPSPRRRKSKMQDKSERVWIKPCAHTTYQHVHTHTKMHTDKNTCMNKHTTPHSARQNAPDNGRIRNMFAAFQNGGIHCVCERRHTFFRLSFVWVDLESHTVEDDQTRTTMHTTRSENMKSRQEF